MGVDIKLAIAAFVQKMSEKLEQNMSGPRAVYATKELANNLTCNCSCDDCGQESIDDCCVSSIDTFNFWTCFCRCHVYLKLKKLDHLIDRLLEHIVRIEYRGGRLISVEGRELILWPISGNWYVSLTGETFERNRLLTTSGCRITYQYTVYPTTGVREFSEEIIDELILLILSTFKDIDSSTTRSGY
jgi:hypothetical protein